VADTSGLGVADGAGVAAGVGAAAGVRGVALPLSASTPLAGRGSGRAAAGVAAGAGRIRVKVGVALGVGTMVSVGEDVGDGLGVARGRDGGMLKLSSPWIVAGGAAVFDCPATAIAGSDTAASTIARFAALNPVIDFTFIVTHLNLCRPP
jgi:hypothetical protein